MNHDYNCPGITCKHWDMRGYYFSVALFSYGLKYFVIMCLDLFTDFFHMLHCFSECFDLK